MCKTQNSTGPRIEPCGTPQEEKQQENFSKRGKPANHMAGLAPDGRGLIRMEGGFGTKAEPLLALKNMKWD